MTIELPATQSTEQIIEQTPPLFWWVSEPGSVRTAPATWASVRRFAPRQSSRRPPRLAAVTWCSIRGRTDARDAPFGAPLAIFLGVDVGRASPPGVGGALGLYFRDVDKSSASEISSRERWLASGLPLGSRLRCWKANVMYSHLYFHLMYLYEGGGFYTTTGGLMLGKVSHYNLHHRDHRPVQVLAIRIVTGHPWLTPLARTTMPLSSVIRSACCHCYIASPLLQMQTGYPKHMSRASGIID